MSLPDSLKRVSGNKTRNFLCRSDRHLLYGLALREVTKTGGDSFEHLGQTTQSGVREL